jgi:hypothetical protein
MIGAGKNKIKLRCSVGGGGTFDWYAPTKSSLTCYTFVFF